MKVPQRLYVAVRQGEILQKDLAVPNSGEYGPAQGVGLLHDLLEHEVFIAAFFRRVNFPVHPADFLFNGLHQMVVAPDAGTGQHRGFAVLHVADVSGVAQDGGNIAGQEAAPAAVSQDQGAVLPGGDDLAGRIGGEDAQRVRPLNAPEAAAHRCQDIRSVPLEIFHQLRHHLGIGF